MNKSLIGFVSSAILVSLCIFSRLRVSAEEPPNKSDLELYAFLTRFEDKLFLNLRITNLASTPKTVLTKQPSLVGGGGPKGGARAPYIGISYWIFGTSSPGDRTWKFIPSLPDLGPVTLLKDETASMTIPLEPELAATLKDPDVIFSIDYVIREDIAVWHGKLSLKESVASLLRK
jgi:hypothetical protein